jgi:ACS family glucarate transporter-like MFS transporter
MTNFRWKVAWLIFILSFVSYMDRVNLSVATPVIMKEYGFDKVDMGLIQTFFFAGYALMQVPGGMMAEKFGHRITGTLAVIWWSVFTVLTACAKGKFSFAAIRFLFGMGEGPVYPAFGIAIYRWYSCLAFFIWLAYGFYPFWSSWFCNGLLLV